tara:strand:+ start:190 stop:570 length:381 start_codon:yes stop_codon:yes gene_type:complete
MINIPVSLRELIDEISILLIKQVKIKEKIQLLSIKKELSYLNKILDKQIKKKDAKNYLNKLKKINSKLWKIEDDIRDCERKKKFNKKFIDLARLVYKTNDMRSQLKSEINKKYDSKIIEVKSYKNY